MDRAHVELDAEGQIVVDIAKLYKCLKGDKNEFNVVDRTVAKPLNKIQGM